MLQLYISLHLLMPLTFRYFIARREPKECYSQCKCNVGQHRRCCSDWPLLSHKQAQNESVQTRTTGACNSINRFISQSYLQENFDETLCKYQLSTFILCNRFNLICTFHQSTLRPQFFPNTMCAMLELPYNSQ